MPSSVKSTEQLLRAMGRKSVRSQERAGDVEEGIKAARMVFPRCYFDQTKAARALECLKRYQRRIHQVTNEPMEPLHDEFSHGADGFRYLAGWIDAMRNESDHEFEMPPAPDWRT